MTHCQERGLEAILGSKSHIFIHEQGGIAQVNTGRFYVVLFQNIHVPVTVN